MPLAKEHNASQVRRAAACCSASETAVFSDTALSSFFAVSPGAEVTSRAFNCDSMVESVVGCDCECWRSRRTLVDRWWTGRPSLDFSPTNNKEKKSSWNWFKDEKESHCDWLNLCANGTEEQSAELMDLWRWHRIRLPSYNFQIYAMRTYVYFYFIAHSPFSHQPFLVWELLHQDDSWLKAIQDSSLLVSWGKEYSRVDKIVKKIHDKQSSHCRHQ